MNILYVCIFHLQTTKIQKIHLIFCKKLIEKDPLKIVHKEILLCLQEYRSKQVI